MGYDKYDDIDNIEGQTELFPAPEKMFAVSDVFARAKKNMSLAEYKTFVYALTEVKWKEKMPNVVYLDKRTLGNVLGIHSDASHLSHDIHQEIKDLAKHSEIHITEKDLGIYDDGQFITRVTMTMKDKDTGKRIRNVVRVKFEEEYLSMFGNLEKNYITMWSSDIFQMKNERSITFYEYLRAHSDTTKECQHGLGVKALKELFNIPKEAYMREKGGFDRANFEKKIIEPICEDLKNCTMIQLVPNEDGKLYRKVKQGSRVRGYEFVWNVSDRPRIATAEEVKEVRENISKDPQILKISKDIVQGKKKNGVGLMESPSTPKTASEWEELEKRLLDN